METPLIHILTDSWLFVFGILPNVFNVIYPEIYFIATKRQFELKNRVLKWVVCYFSVIVPFSWVLLYAMLVVLNKIVKTGEDVAKLATSINIELDKEDILDGSRL